MVLAGDRLSDFAFGAGVHAPRSIVGDILEKYACGKSFLLFGLRRTGKSTAMRHAISALSAEERAKTAFITCAELDRFQNLRADMFELEEPSIRNVFVDEATYLDDFIYSYLERLFVKNSADMAVRRTQPKMSRMPS